MMLVSPACNENARRPSALSLLRWSVEPGGLLQAIVQPGGVTDSRTAREPKQTPGTKGAIADLENGFATFRETKAHCADTWRLTSDDSLRHNESEWCSLDSLRRACP